MQWSDLKTVRGDGKPARILIHSLPGVGKTTLGSEFPDAVFLQAEEGTPSDVDPTTGKALEITSFGHIVSYNDFIDSLELLYAEAHEFRVAVVDTATKLERLIFAEVCVRNNVASIEDLGYGKGYAIARDIWQEVIDRLNALRNDRGMTIVILAHSKVSQFDDPETQSYSRYDIALHKGSVGAIEQEMDAILFLRTPVTVKEDKNGGGFKKRVLSESNSSVVEIHSTPRAAWIAKNRYGIPSRLTYKKGDGFKTIGKYLPGFAEEAQTPLKAVPVKRTAGAK